MIAFTEEEIRDVMADHRPGVSPQYCLCSWVNGTFQRDGWVIFGANHLIAVLKEYAGVTP